VARTAWGLYVHIPFCPYKCAYCDFVALPDGPRVRAWHAPYVRDVLAEARLWAERLRPAAPPATIFYGGGTPTRLEPAALAALHAGLVGTFGCAQGAEVTVECNPGTVDEAGLRALRAVGANRLSIGLQAAQDRLLEALGRRHLWSDFEGAWRAARAAGFDNLSVDVMYGLPAQTLADLGQTLGRVLDLRPEHVSAYALQVEEGTVLHARARRGELPLPDEAQVGEHFDLCRRRLAQAGYEHYEISNFALRGRRCRHNLLYWENGDWLGLGVGAHSHWCGERWANTPRLAAYRDALAAGEGWIASRELPDAWRACSEGAFLGLRLLDGLDLSAYARRYGRPLAAAFPGAVERLVAEGLCEVAGGRLRLRPEAVALGNRAFAAFV
jgi:oxygen-independent coproporphyrinogen-3 oxidase